MPLREVLLILTIIGLGHGVLTLYDHYSQDKLTTVVWVDHNDRQHVSMWKSGCENANYERSKHLIKQVLSHSVRTIDPVPMQ